MGATTAMIAIIATGIIVTDIIGITMIAIEIATGIIAMTAITGANER